jgi:hypothetical protein
MNNYKRFLGGSEVLKETLVYMDYKTIGIFMEGLAATENPIGLHLVPTHFFWSLNAITHLGGLEPP